MLQRWHSSSICEKLIIWSINFDPSRRGIWTLYLKTPILCMCAYFNQGFTSIPSSKSRSNKIFTSCPYFITSTLQPLDLLSFVGMMIFLLPRFIIKLLFTCKWLIKTNVDDSKLKCPRNQGWSENTCLFISVLRATPNHIPVKYGCPTKISNQIRHVYLRTR